MDRVLLPRLQRRRLIEPNPSKTSESLLHRARDHDPEAWQVLVNIYSPLVYRWARQRGLQAADAADVMQEVFRTANERLPSFEQHSASGHFRGWLWTVTRSKIVDLARRRAKIPNALGGTAALEQLAALPDHEPRATSAAVTDNPLIQNALGLVREEFEPNTWQAFWRTAVDGATVADVAEELSLTANAVRIARHRVIRRLRSELAGLL